MRRLALVCAVLVGCSDDGGGPIPIDNLQGELINAICSVYVNCGLVHDMATCRMIVQADSGIDASLFAAVEAGKVKYNADKARECLNGLGGSCERGTSFGPSSAACEQVFEGTVGAGGECTMDEMCKSRDCDIPSCPDACCKGTCVGDVPIARPTVGQSCASNTFCVDSYCDFATTTCAPYRAEGQPCTSSTQCGANVCSNEVCRKRPGPGESCDASSFVGQCGHVGYTCSFATMTCVPFALLGESCGTEAACSEFYTCDDGTCQLGPRLGEACGELAGDCIDGSYCELTTMKCAGRKTNGLACNDDDQCQSDYCDVATESCASEPICI